MPNTTETLSLGFDTNPMIQGFRKVGAASKRFKSSFQTNMMSISRSARKTGLILSASLTAPLVLVAREMWKSASQFEATQAKFSTVFGEMSDDMDAYLAKWKQITPATRAQARGIASGIQDILIPMGFARDEASGLTKDTLRLVGALANFNSDTRTATEVSTAFTSALTGMFRPLKSLGINTSKAAVDQRAVAMGLAATTKEVTHQARAQALLIIATEQSQDALAAFNKESLDTKVRVTIAFNALKDSFISFSDSILPIMSKVAKAVKGMADWIKSLSPENRKWIMTIGAVVAALGPMALIIAGVTFVLGKLSIGIAAMGVAARVAMGPTGILILGLGVLVTAVMQNEKFMRAFGMSLDKASGTMRNKTIPVVEFLNMGMLILIKSLVLVGRHIINAFFAAGHYIREFGKMAGWVFNNIGELAKRMVDNIEAYFTNLGSNLKNLTAAIWGFIKGDGWDFKWDSIGEGTQDIFKDMPKMAEFRMSQVVANADVAMKDLDEKMRKSKRRIDIALAGGSVMSSVSGDPDVPESSPKPLKRVLEEQKEKSTLSSEKASLAVAGSLAAYRAEIQSKRGPDKMETATVETASNTAKMTQYLAKIAGRQPSFNGVLGIT